MNITQKYTFLILGILSLSLVACSTTPMEVTLQSKPGFANITDVPIPESAKIDINKSMVMGGGDAWTGHLVYTTKRSHVEVIDFVTRNMLARRWSKVSELRGIETVITFMKNHRVATVRVMVDKGYISNETIISIDMSNSDLTHAGVVRNEENSNRH